MNIALRRSYRLVTRGGAGLACDKDGLALGAVDLARVRLDEGCVSRCEVRSPDEIGQILRAAYGPQPDRVVFHLHRGLRGAAASIEAGDLGRAGIEAVKLGFPDLTAEAMAKLAEIADLETSNKGWETEPRVAAGEAGAGQWTTDGGGAPAADSRPTGTASDCVGGFDQADHGLLVHVNAAAAAVGGFGVAGDIALPSGVARLGRAGLLTFGAALLNDLSARGAREQVTNAIARFGLDPSRPADVVAASAYVWSRYALPLLLAEAPFRGPALDAASQAVMRLVLVKPGAFVAMQQNSNVARGLIIQAAKGGLADYASESRARPAGVEPELQTTSESARAVIASELQGGNLWAHHLVPAGVWKRNIEIARLALKDDWKPNNPSNLIGLPADPATQQALGDLLPIHNDFHPKYDKVTQYLIDAARWTFPPNLTPMQAHAILDTVAILNRELIFAREYHQIMKAEA